MKRKNLFLSFPRNYMMRTDKVPPLLSLGPFSLSPTTTPDREFDLDTVACFGCCVMAPVTVVDHKVEGKVEPTRVDGILLSYQLQKEKEGKEEH